MLIFLNFVRLFKMKLYFAYNIEYLVLIFAYQKY